MSDDHAENEVSAVVGRGFIASWRGQFVQATGGGLHYFDTEKDAWDFLELCDAVNGMPTPPPRRPMP
jgi:hypothetical protein